MASFAAVAQIQTYLRKQAFKSYQAVALPPFTLFFHPSDPLRFFNYAIPDEPTHGDLGVQLAELRRVFQSRQRTARFEFFEAFAPQLPQTLLDHGFVEEDRQWSMICTPGDLQMTPDVPDLEIIPLSANSSTQDVADFITTQRTGFGETDRPVSSDPAELRQELERMLRGWQGFLGRIDGQPVGVSAYGLPIDGIGEIAGIATLPAFRRRGIAARLTAEAARHAFSHQVEMLCLTAADAAAGRVYEHVGFKPFSTMLAYLDSSPS
jgi:ribosomal protein S18 acetylase RimI-like enzyme